MDKPTLPRQRLYNFFSVALSLYILALPVSAAHGSEPAESICGGIYSDRSSLREIASLASRAEFQPGGQKENFCLSVDNILQIYKNLIHLNVVYVENAYPKLLDDCDNGKIKACEELDAYRLEKYSKLYPMWSELNRQLINLEAEQAIFLKTVNLPETLYGLKKSEYLAEMADGSHFFRTRLSEYRNSQEFRRLEKAAQLLLNNSGRSPNIGMLMHDFAVPTLKNLVEDIGGLCEH